MSTNMTGGADGGIAIQVKLDTSKASKELTRLEQKILKLQEEVTVGKAKKSALVAQLEQANAELTALQAKTKIDGKSFVISPEDSKRISDLKIQIEQTQTAIEQQNKALSDAQLTLEGVKTRYGEVTQQAQALAAAEQETAGGSMQEAREHVEQTAQAFAEAQRNAEGLNDTMDGTQGSASRMEKAAMKVQKSMERSVFEGNVKYHILFIGSMNERFFPATYIVEHSNIYMRDQNLHDCRIIHEEK